MINWVDKHFKGKKTVVCPHCFALSEADDCYVCMGMHRVLKKDEPSLLLCEANSHFHLSKKKH
jgi:recombinational DNA repair protein RecR|tara:strand:+ start:280 stop:468 length:189 start_codon:yes stop_codon:yes gene_type:complete